jgi:gamma-glutamyltranspeptidase/glutathione hydrolase
MGRNGVVSSGHCLASLAGVEILQKGGNAFDAGIATVMCLNILQPDYAGFVGVSPFIGYSAAEKNVVCYSGVGVAPQKATIDFYRSRGYEVVPRPTILSHLIPASVDTWIAVLKRLGTMSFGEVAASARALAFDGFPAHRLLIHVITKKEQDFRNCAYNESIFFQTGGIPKLGERFVQKDAARSIDLMIAAESRALKAGKSRNDALEAVRDVFYKGEIARAIEALHEKEGGLFTYEDLAGYHGKWEPSLSTAYNDYTFHTPSTWTQGPLMLQYLNILEALDLSSMAHNSAAYINLLAGVIDLGMADREKYFGDPDAVDVPAGLWSKEYAAARRLLVSPDRGFSELPPHGDPENCRAVGGTLSEMISKYKDIPETGQTDTTYACAADAEGNLFSLTPSDGGYGSPMVPGYGIILGGRMTQFRLTPGHPAALSPGKRPTITPAPVLVMKNGKPHMALGTPGADMQTQSMLQVFLNTTEFDMNVQEAIEAPRFGSYNFPAWFSPHEYYPGRICLEDRIDPASRDGLKALGRRVIEWEAWTNLTGAVCAVVFDHKTGTIHGGADPRRESYAVGW